MSPSLEKMRDLSGIRPHHPNVQEFLLFFGAFWLAGLAIVFLKDQTPPFLRLLSSSLHAFAFVLALGLPLWRDGELSREGYALQAASIYAIYRILSLFLLGSVPEIYVLAQALFQGFCFFFVLVWIWLFVMRLTRLPFWLVFALGFLAGELAGVVAWEFLFGLMQEDLSIHGIRSYIVFTLKFDALHTALATGLLFGGRKLTSNPLPFD